MRAEGQLTADTYSQLLSQGLDLTEPLRKVTGRSGEAMRSALSAGAVSFNQFRAMLIAATSEGGQFYQSLERQNETFKGQTTQIEREINALFGEFGEGAATALSGPLKDFSSWLDGLRPKAREVGEEFGHWIDGIDKLRREGKLGDYLKKEFDGAVDHFVSYLGSKVTLQNLLGPANPKGPVAAANASNPLIRFMDLITSRGAVAANSNAAAAEAGIVPSQEEIQATKDTTSALTDLHKASGEAVDSLQKFAEKIGLSTQFPTVGEGRYPQLGFGGGSSATNIAAAVGKAAAQGVVEGLASTRASVFGLNMDGSRDKLDNQTGAFRDPLTGRSFNTGDPGLAGAALPVSVTGGDPGFVFVKNGAKYDIVPVVDKGPADWKVAQGVGLDLTPKARRGIGIEDDNNDAVSYKFFHTLEEAQKFVTDVAKLPVQVRPESFEWSRQYLAANQGRGGAGSSPAARLPALNGPVRQVSNPANTPAFGDAKTVQEATAEIEKIQELVAATTLDAQEGARRIADITARAAGSIYNPTQFTQFLGRYRAAMLERERVAKATQDKIARGEASVAEAAIAGVHKATDAYANTRQVISDIAQRGTEQLGDGLSGALVDSATNGKDAWKDFAVSFLKDIEKMILKALILKAINAAIGGFTGSGASFAGGNGIEATSFNGTAINYGDVGGHHSGGIVGGTPTFTRNVDLSIFDGAPRFHGGGVVGLKPGEVPIIAMEGERVLTEEQQRMSQLAPVEAMGGSVSNSNHIEIHVQPGGQATANGGGGQDDQAFYKRIGGMVQQAVDARVSQQIADGKRSGGAFNPRGRGR